MSKMSPLGATFRAFCRSEGVPRMAYFIPVRDGRRVWPNRVLVGASWPVRKGTGRAESSDAQK